MSCFFYANLQGVYNISLSVSLLLYGHGEMQHQLRQISAIAAQPRAQRCYSLQRFKVYICVQHDDFSGPAPADDTALLSLPGMKCVDVSATYAYFILLALMRMISAFFTL